MQLYLQCLLRQLGVCGCWLSFAFQLQWGRLSIRQILCCCPTKIFPCDKNQNGLESVNLLFPASQLGYWMKPRPVRFQLKYASATIGSQVLWCGPQHVVPACR